MFNDSAAEEAIVDSVKEFAASGGGCLVENSTLGLSRKSAFMKRVSQETGVHVIAGAGKCSVCNLTRSYKYFYYS